MNIFTQIEKANYCVSLDTVKALAVGHLAAQQTVGKTPGAYFRILLAATQQAICGKPTLRARGKVPSLTDEEIAQHLETFEKVNTSLYAVILEAVRSSDVESRPNLGTDEQNRRAKERNRRTNFARSAASTLRAYIRQGGNVLRLAVPSATKSAVAGMTPSDNGKPVPLAERTAKRIDSAASRIVASADELAAKDKAKAVAVLQSALAVLGEALQRLGPKATTKPGAAMEEHRPLRTPMGIFWPSSLAAQ